MPFNIMFDANRMLTTVAYEDWIVSFLVVDLT